MICLFIDVMRSHSVNMVTKINIRFIYIYNHYYYIIPLYPVLNLKMIVSWCVHTYHHVSFKTLFPRLLQNPFVFFLFVWLLSVFAVAVLRDIPILLRPENQLLPHKNFSLKNKNFGEIVIFPSDKYILSNLRVVNRKSAECLCSFDVIRLVVVFPF